jgi:glutaminyl-tRNA synthetase
VAHAVNAEVRLYDNLFRVENPSDAPEGQDFTANLNPHSLEVIANAKLEPALANAKPGDRYQFERLGYFCADKDSTARKLVFNRTATLKDSWAKAHK